MDPLDHIRNRTRRLLEELPSTVTLVVAAKSRSLEETLAVVEAGVRVIGHNYVQEAQAHREGLPKGVQLHMIGHLQRNKAKKALEVFDMIQTLDSLKLASELNRICSQKDSTAQVLVEVNSGKEPQKSGVLPEDLFGFLEQLQELPHIIVKGLMTMGPLLEDPEDLRPYFRLTKELFENARKLKLSNSDMEILSMGMSDSYKVAIQEGANMVRIGTLLFGPRTKG